MTCEHLPNQQRQRCQRAEICSSIFRVAGRMALACCLLAGATIICWLRSYVVSDHATWVCRDGWTRIHSSFGKLQIDLRTWELPSHAQPKRRFVYQRNPPTPVSTRSSRLGFEYRSGEAGPRRYSILTLPYWSLVAVTCLFPLWKAGSVLRRR